MLLQNPQRKRRYIPKHDNTELGIQKRVCSYLRKHYPDVIFRSDFASGLKLTQNQAIVHKSLQSAPGWPDLFIYYPTVIKHKDGSERRYAGLAIELKADGVSIYCKIGPNKGQLVASEHIRAQAAMLKLLNQRGYLARFCVGYDAAVKLIDYYMGAPENSTLF